MPAVSGCPSFNSDGMKLRVEFPNHVAGVLEVLNEGRGIRRENLPGFLAAEGKDLLNLSIHLHVLIDYSAINAARLALDAAHLFDSRGFRKIIQILVISHVQLVQDIHVSVSFFLVVGGIGYIDIIPQCYQKCKYLLRKYEKVIPYILPLFLMCMWNPVSPRLLLSEVCGRPLL